jgi:hypothetical protein
MSTAASRQASCDSSGQICSNSDFTGHSPRRWLLRHGRRGVIRELYEVRLTGRESKASIADNPDVVNPR